MGQILVHMHSNRLNWLERRAPELGRDVTRVHGDQADDRALLPRAPGVCGSGRGVSRPAGM